MLDQQEPRACMKNFFSDKLFDWELGDYENDLNENL